VAVGLVLAAAGLSLLRQPGVPAVDSIWAEDGQVFYNQAVQWSFLHSLFTPYNGYFQLVPRVMIESVTLLPVNAAAAAIFFLLADQVIRVFVTLVLGIGS